MTSMVEAPPTLRTTELRERVALAMEREIQAHNRAIQLHEASARIFDRHGNTARAAGARQRAQHAREMLAVALRERESFRAITSHPHEHASLSLPPDGTLPR